MERPVQAQGVHLLRPADSALPRQDFGPAAWSGRPGSRTGTHLSSNLNRENPTIEVPFMVMTEVAYPKERRTLGDYLRKQ